MGQRNATYIIVKRGKEETILPIYNQWNFIKIQLPKLVRGIKEVLNYTDLEWSISAIPYIYFTAAGKNSYNEDEKEKTQWVGGNIELPLYLDGSYTNAFQEDNNNGWNIVRFTLDYDKPMKVELFCIVGSEDEDYTTNDSLRDYFKLKRDIEDEQEKAEYETNLQYLEQHTAWQPSLQAEAKHLLKRLIKKSMISI